MTKAEIIQLVMAETGIDVTAIHLRGSDQETFARYVAMIMMREEGIPVAEIAQALNMMRITPYASLKTINKYLGNNKPFKTLYLACIKRMADMEENNNDTETHLPTSLCA